MKHKAIALISGGLDSILAAKIVQKQEIEIKGVVFVMQFASRDIDGFSARVKESADAVGINIKVADIAEEFLKVLGSPDYGYGSQVNPCIDCKIFMLRKAKEMMEKEKADFVITGEVLGERPMSQRKEALHIIKKNSGLENYLLRPLSAKLLAPTVPEEKEIIDREKLFDISGRSRKPQLALAKQYGIKKFFSPASGCLLTDPMFAKRVRDLMERREVTGDNIAFLKYGRHFRLEDGTKAIVGRDEKENEILSFLKKEDDMILRMKEKAGPELLLRGKKSSENIKKAAMLVIGHSKSKHSDSEIVEFWEDEKDVKTLSARAMSRAAIDRLRV